MSPSDTKYHAMSVSAVYEMLSTSPRGLSGSEAERRLLTHGQNSISASTSTSFFSILFGQFSSPLIIILLFASLLTAYLGEITETIVILSSVLINVAFSTYQEYRAEHTIEHLKSLVRNRALVIRDGVSIEIPAEDLVVGDTIELSYGSRVPADCRIVSATDLQIDESILTGESLPVAKTTTVVSSDIVSERTNHAFCGTHITSGLGVGVVVHTGDHTEIGKIARSLGTPKRVLTPVQNAVQDMSRIIFIIALCVVVLVFFLGLYRGESLVDMLVLSSAVAVGAVPEALPIALTIILSFGALRILKKGGLVRKLAASETLGSTTLILTDKTGTITMGTFALDGVLTITELMNNVGKSIISGDFAPDATHVQLLRRAFRNNTAHIERIGKDQNDWVFSGSTFDVAVVKVLVRYGIILLPDPKSKIILPFNSTNKFSVSVENNIFTILGAPDILISHSILSAPDRENLLSHIEVLSLSGKRVVAIGTGNFSSPSMISEVELLGIFVFSDPVRPHVAQCISEIQSRGVAVKLISGDLAGTVRFIGERVGIYSTDSSVLTGTDLSNLSDEDLLKILPTISVFARATPEDKLRIGTLYQSLGHIVAMTGDGVNDAPVLRAMDIGVSLSSGSDVAKSASDMVLTSNDFQTIADTVTEGRIIKANIQKVFVYLMSTSLDEVFIIAGSLIAGYALPLTALQIIWVNILTGTLPALAFAYEHQTGTARVESQNSTAIFSRHVQFLALGIGTVSSLLLFALYALLHLIISDVALLQSLFFLCFALYILVVSYSFRDLYHPITSYPIFSNWRLNVANIIGVVAILCTAYTPIGQRIFGLVTVPFSYIWVLALWLVLNVLLVEIGKHLSASIRFR